jgi:ABC-2 type transport system ATP-binding protein
MVFVMDAIKVSKLKKVFESSRRIGWLRSEKVEVLSVREVSFDVPAGQSVAFIGPNGAGKSTTIKMLTGILRPTSGTAEVLGVVPWLQRSKLAYNVGTVFGQRSQLWYHLPPDDTFELLSRIYNLDRAEYKSRRDMLVERFGIASFLHTPVRKLSLGQRMKAEVAASLLHKPRLLFLDEPTIGLDVNARQQLRDLIREWNRDEGLTVFLTSHDAGDIEHVAERVIVINEGEIVLDDTVRNVRTDFLGTKVLTVDFHEAPNLVPMSGVTELGRDGYNLKLEVDTSLVSIESVISQVLSWAPVADITIEDPPLEHVIAHIYAQHNVRSSDVESPRQESLV